MVRTGNCTVNAQVGDATTPFESFTCTANAPVAVGVPVRAPVELLRVSPAGRAPVTIEKVKGEIPPLTLSELVTGVPTVRAPAGHVNVGGPTIVIMQAPTAAIPFASFT